jgi:archaellum biogenesis protein FlaJ (TadC family)
MWGVLAKIFGSGDVIKSGIQLIDDMHTSTEEEINAKTKAKTDLLSAYAPFKLAQRYLAVMFAVTFLSSFVLVLGMTLYGQGDIEAVKQILGDFFIGEIMLTIVLFYFGGGAFEGVTEKLKKKG